MSEKIAFAKTQVDETKDIMVKNIGSLLERGERLEDLDAKTQMLSETSQSFYRSGRSLKCQVVRENMCLSVAILLLILIVLGATVFFIYEIVKHV